MIRFLISLILLLVVIAALVGWIRTYILEHGENQTAFRGGTATLASFDGEYVGAAAGYLGSWQGKTITQATASGINRFSNDGSVTTRYPFALSVGKGLRDKDMDVIKLDYNQAGNPWWLTFIVDEVVEVSPNHYLGKVHIHVMPGVTFTVVYFTLEKP